VFIYPSEGRDGKRRSDTVYASGVPTPSSESSVRAATAASKPRGFFPLDAKHDT
jgi:hypothetical protein